MNKKKREAKTIPRQYELFVEELENNAGFRKNTVDKIWKKLVAKLNTCGGPQRSVDAWKRVLIDWKSHIRRKDKIMKMKTRSKCKDKKLSDLEVRLLRIMGSAKTRGKKNAIQPTIPAQIQDAIVIENSDRIEFVDEEGSIISNTDKLEFTCDGPQITNNYDQTKRLPEAISSLAKEQQKLCDIATSDSTDSDTFQEASHQNNETGSQFKELSTELAGIKSVLEKQLKELQIQNEINKLRARIDYEKAKAKYENFNLKIQF